MWKYIAITLDPNSSRYKDFLSINSFLDIEAYQGIRGNTYTKEQIVSNGLVTRELASSELLTAGALGCAASHRGIWEIVSRENTGCVVLEDDCYLHPKINYFIEKHLDILMSVDVCFFGINTDSVLLSISTAGLKSLSIFDPKHPNQQWISNAFSKTNIDNIRLDRFLKGFGTCAYFISPNGAKNMEEKIFPLSLKTTQVPLVSDKMPATSIDRAGCREYLHLNAYICNPFLAYTPNIDSSTKQ